MWTKQFFVVLYILCEARADDVCPGLPLCFCNKDKTSVNCEGKQLTAIPDTIPQTAVKLYLDNNKITTVKSYQLAYLPKLVLLRLDRNFISTIEPFAFGNLTYLKDLDLRENKITQLKKNALSGMPALEKLYLMTCKIQEIETDAMDGCESLTDLYLQSNHLTVIPAFGKLKHLRSLIMEGNLVVNATFPDVFQESKSFRRIVLSNNNIQKLDNDTFLALENRTMSSILLSRNKITKADSGVFQPINRIQSLKLGTNPIDDIDLQEIIKSIRGKPVTALDLSNLKLGGILLNKTFSLLKNTSIQALNLKHNSIKTLVDNVFDGLNKLVDLDLTSCKIQVTYADSFNGLENLNNLVLNNNLLTDIPMNLPAGLLNLYIDNNQIISIPNKIFSNQFNMRKLYLSHNKILTLMQDSFVGLGALEQLNLYDNIIATIPGHTFDPLIALTDLNFAKNNLANIQKSTGRFKNQGALKYLNLADNNCFYLQPDFFKYTVSLIELHLERNNLGEIIAQDNAGTMFIELKKLQKLYLNDNVIHNFPALTFQSLASLKTLNISRNKLKGWDGDLFSITNNLHTLDASNNLIWTIDSDNLTFLQFLRYLNLSGNPFMCDCELRWFRDWIDNTPVLLTSNATYTCHGPDQWSGVELLSFSRKEINCWLFTWRMLLTCFLVAMVHSSIMYKKRWPLKLFIYKMTRKWRQWKNGETDRAIADEDGKEFDAYISYADEDTDWVRGNLLPGVDKGEIDGQQFGGGFALYFSERDSVPGRSTVGQIFEAITASRKVIVVLSKNYLPNAMHLWELDQVHSSMLEREIENFIVIHIDKGLPNAKIPIEITAKMRRNDILEWTEKEDAQALVKARLNEMLAQRDLAAERDTE
ncbi:TLR4-like protein [Mya arenaria]|uniref:TLR4-like protein n=1 Tax=Mya arenaria TaxID=6604 RepID=A0ABY7ESL9_MYAAR|nr:insulin-like growth factor-binding protein complex acid labile subunit [Mya arenaria]XP_052819134.1 insulin-like growth factor-binding protein complex acid labile subunit [Mya arenaria]XP_052819135.1 insulin-like growth factor-binding protein complex acid labile subunit [Mya arenaria]XP_052819137.1 insulin-like growth factor-binding protein complex acid labile subunit [Mya arenaria]WAR11558.1 TLR4-like protein [Mya arenaria]